MKEETDLPHYIDEHSKDLTRVEKLAKIFDARFTLPGTEIRYGWDSIIGLIPGIGDTLTLIPQAYLVSVALKLKLGPAIVAKMLGNVALDFLVGLIPVLGDVFDVAFKSNLRNANLVAEGIRKKRTTEVSSSTSATETV